MDAQGISQRDRGGRVRKLALPQLILRGCQKQQTEHIDISTAMDSLLFWVQINTTFDAVWQRGIGILQVYGLTAYYLK